MYDELVWVQASIFSKHTHVNKNTHVGPCQHTLPTMPYLVHYWYMWHQALDSLGVFCAYSISSQKHMNCVMTQNLVTAKYQSVRYQSLMDLRQVCPAPSSSTIPSVSQVHSYFRHISNTPPIVPVPLVSPFIPMFPVSLISISMPLWSSRLSHKFSPPVPVFPCFMLVPPIPSPWLRDEWRGVGDVTEIGMDLGNGRYSRGWRSGMDLSEIHWWLVSNSTPSLKAEPTRLITWLWESAFEARP